MHVLVVEDEPTDSKLVHLIMTSAGHEVKEVDAAEKAYELIKKDKPDVIVLDLVLPGMDGLALARRLKQDSSMRQIPIVAITAYPDRFSYDDAIKAGCDAYLVKPIDTRTLPEEIVNAVKRKSNRKAV